MEPQGKLHLTCRCSGGQCRDSSRSGGTDAVIGEAEVCSIEQVEEFGTELHTKRLVDVEVLVQTGIDRLIAWPDENVTSGIAEGVLGRRNVPVLREALEDIETENGAPLCSVTMPVRSHPPIRPSTTAFTLPPYCRPRPKGSW